MGWGVTVQGSSWERSREPRQRCCEGMAPGLCKDLDETNSPNISFILQNPCESIRGHPAGMTYAANILPHHPARGTFEDFTC